jgi:hypothetical protein
VADVADRRGRDETERRTTAAKENEASFADRQGARRPATVEEEAEVNRVRKKFGASA